jgi:hypothetical protein
MKEGAYRYGYYARGTKLVFGTHYMKVWSTNNDRWEYWINPPYPDTIDPSGVEPLLKSRARKYRNLESVLTEEEKARYHMPDLQEDPGENPENNALIPEGAFEDVSEIALMLHDEYGVTDWAHDLIPRHIVGNESTIKRIQTRS